MQLGDRNYHERQIRLIDEVLYHFRHPGAILNGKAASIKDRIRLQVQNYAMRKEHKQRLIELQRITYRRLSNVK